MLQHRYDNTTTPTTTAAVTGNNPAYVTTPVATWDQVYRFGEFDETITTGGRGSNSDPYCRALGVGVYADQIGFVFGTGGTSNDIYGNTFIGTNDIWLYKPGPAGLGSSTDAQYKYPSDMSWSGSNSTAGYGSVKLLGARSNPPPSRKYHTSVVIAGKLIVYGGVGNNANTLAGTLPATLGG